MRSGKSRFESNLSRFSFTIRRMRSDTSAVCAPSRNRPSKRSPSSRAMKSWKSSSLPWCGVAVISRKWRVSVESSWQAVALRIADLPAEERGGELVGLVANHQVPAAVRRLELRLHVLVARQLVEPGDHQVGLAEPVAGGGRFQLVVGQDVEAQAEAP